MGRILLAVAIAVALALLVRRIDLESDQGGMMRPAASPRELATARFEMEARRRGAAATSQPSAAARLSEAPEACAAPAAPTAPAPSAASAVLSPPNHRVAVLRLASPAPSGHNRDDAASP